MKNKAMIQPNDPEVTHYPMRQINNGNVRSMQILKLQKTFFQKTPGTKV
jgi:hypothetical protein